MSLHMYGPVAVAFNETSGNLLVSDLSTTYSAIFQYDTATQQISKWSKLGTGWVMVNDHRLISTAEVCAKEGMSIYWHTDSFVLTDPCNGLVRKVGPDNIIRQYPGGSGFRVPQSAAFDAQGNLYVADRDALYRVNAGSTARTVVYGNNGLVNQWKALVWLDASNLLGTGVATSQPAGVFKANVATSSLTNSFVIPAAPGGVQLTNPYGAVRDNLGAIFVADASRIFCIRPDAFYTVVAGARNGTTGFKDGPGLSALLNNPATMTLAPDGSVWFVDGYKGKIEPKTVRKLARVA